MHKKANYFEMELHMIKRLKNNHKFTSVVFLNEEFNILNQSQIWLHLFLFFYNILEKADFSLKGNHIQFGVFKFIEWFQTKTVHIASKLWFLFVYIFGFVFY